MHALISIPDSKLVFQASTILKEQGGDIRKSSAMTEWENYYHWTGGGKISLLLTQNIRNFHNLITCWFTRPPYKDRRVISHIQSLKSGRVLIFYTKVHVFKKRDLSVHKDKLYAKSFRPMSWISLFKNMDI